MGEIDPVTHLARMIANHGSKPEAYSAMFWAHFDETIVNEADCKRRSNNPSLKRPGSRSRRSKNPAADSLFALIRRRAGDEERGRLFKGSAFGSD